MRIRGFTQDDSHIFCTRDQIQEELVSLLDFVISVLRGLRLRRVHGQAVDRSPRQGRRRRRGVGRGHRGPARRPSRSRELEYEVDEGGGAFYGPKIDIHVRDAIGRQWQLSTLQVDFQLPERFGLDYIGADNQPHRVSVIHRALFGSVERFFGVLLEHYAGAFPAWLAPVQVRVLGVRDDHERYADEVVTQLRGRRLPGRHVDADEPLGARIRKAKLEKLPYVLVVGDDDVAAGTVGVNQRGGRASSATSPSTTSSPASPPRSRRRDA